MLYMTSANKMTIHAPFVSESEIEKLTILETKRTRLC